MCYKYESKNLQTILLITVELKTSGSRLPYFPPQTPQEQEIGLR